MDILQEWVLIKMKAVTKGGEIKMEKLFMKKLRLALENGLITPYDLAALLKLKSTSQLTRLMNALNKMYSDNELIPVIVDNEKHLMLRK